MSPRSVAPCRTPGKSVSKRRIRGSARIRPAALALGGAILALAAPIPNPAAAPAGKLETAYVVLGGEGAIARAILADTTECPMIDVGGAAERMSVRARADLAFPVLVCETRIPPGMVSAAIGERNLPLPKPTFATIAAFGDAGCRLKAADKGKSDHDHPEAGRFQDCDKLSKWPFSRLSTTVAAQKPDLVIHVGDYLYRESPCPEGDKGCKGSPYGDNWQTWQADFFRPADPLLAAAPWIVVRGNHEICARAGLGFFRFLHPALARNNAPLACTDLVAPYTAEVGRKSFLVMDSSNALDTCANDACDSAPYAAQFASLKPKPGTWFLSHRPVWAIGRKFTLNQTLQQTLKSSDGRLPQGIELALSGHMHIFELLSFTDQRPPQLVVGTGGTALDKKINRDLDGMTVGGATVSYGRWERRFGFLMIAPQKDGSPATFVDPRGKARFKCALTPSTARCD
jgi:hypothetical protein